MRAWTPQTLYEAKPWAFIGIGVILAIGTMLWSLSAGLWSVWRGLLCFGGAALAIVGGATLQLRQDYRPRRKWRRRAGRLCGRGAAGAGILAPFHPQKPPALAISQVGALPRPSP